MTPRPPGLADFSPGDEQPDPVARLIAFGFYDGETDGVLETHSGHTYRFDFIGEWPALGEPDSVRMFLVSPLPDGAFSRLVELISPHCPPRTPYWVPSWWHLRDDQKAELDHKVDAVLASASSPEWAVAGQFLCEQALRVRAADLTAEEAASGDAGRWAAVFGLTAPGATSSFRATS